MKNSALRVFILTCLFNVTLEFGWNRYFKTRMTWLEAREYCRKHHIDLSSISTPEEDQNFFKSLKPDSVSARGWIGLYKDADDVWKWSGGENALFFNWSKMQNNTQDKCVVQHESGWRRRNCKSKYRFFCFDRSLVLVKENKTWEEAMEHCRQQHTDLVSLPSESALKYTLQISREAQTGHVWTGLRYLADNWLWVNGDSVRFQAWSGVETPHCPAWTHHCGALSLEGQHWESWNCADKLNFVCNSNT